MPDKDNVISLRLERQFLSRKANQQEYLALYRDTQPGQNVYWNGFGDPPSITFRADFDDMEFNRKRQHDRSLIKGRWQGGNLGWIQREDLELFAGLVIGSGAKALRPTDEKILNLIKQEGSMNIALMKELTGLLVKEITPILHRLQESLLIYEDQFDGEWDRAWYLFPEMFPNVDIHRYTRTEALMIILKRFSYRNVLFDVEMARSFYKLPAKDIKLAVQNLVKDGTLVSYDDSYILQSDLEVLQNRTHNKMPPSVFVLHRNDFLVKSNEHWLKERYKQSDCDILQYILIDGEFSGAVVGKFKNGPYILNDVVLDLSDTAKQQRRDEIINAIYQVNDPQHSPLQRYCNKRL